MAKTRSLAPILYVNSDSATDRRYMDQMAQQDIFPVPTNGQLPRFTIVVGPSPFSMPRGWEFFLTSPYEGVTYIATILHNASYPVRIVDVRFVENAMDQALTEIAQGTDVLGIATFEDNYPFVKKLIENVKERSPSLPIIVGGSLVTSVPDVFMKHTKADIAVLSEGEITILELMDAYADGNWPKSLPTINGICYRDEEGNARQTQPRGQMPDLECLPKMRLDLWPQARGENGIQPQIIASYSRGCKMDCSFRYRTIPQERVKSPEKLDRELAWLRQQYGVEFVFFVDLTFTSHKQQTLEYMDVLKPHGLSWTCLTRCADLDEERLQAMEIAGADIILCGVESLGKEVLKTARKGNSENVTERAMHKTWDAGIRFGALLILGLPGETEESLDHMCQWAEQHQHVTRVKYLSAMPGTTVYNDGVGSGIIKSAEAHLNWLSIEQALHHDEFLNYNDLPESVIRKAYKRIYDSYLPGPVLGFEDWPAEAFEPWYPNSDYGSNHAKDYRDYLGVGGKNWRADHSSYSRPWVAGSHRFTLSKVGTPEQAKSNIQVVRDEKGLPIAVIPDRQLLSVAE